jgi:dolichyl-phosphate-mannose--protein O-mannosyl transferase
VQSLLSWLKRPAIALLIIGAFAGALRLHHLGSPAQRIFDEAYYSKDGCLYAGHTPKQCAIENSGEKYWVIQRADDRGETSWVHPQLGKWAIAAGILGEGNRAFGWRISSAAAGTAVVVMTAAMAWLLFGSILWTYITGLLIATETLEFVQSRVSMLDIFQAFWVVMGFLCLLLDRRWIDRRTPRPADSVAVVSAALSPGPGAMAVDEQLRHEPVVPRWPVPSPIWRPWRFAAGFAFGCGVATKWSATMALLAAAFLVLGWEFVRRRRANDPSPLWSTVRMELLGWVLAFAILPVAVYLVSYTHYFVNQGWHNFLPMQFDALHFHSGLHYITDTGKHAHPYESKPWMWLPMTRPVSYYYESPGGPGTSAEVLAMGHPLLFWTSIITLPVVAWQWLKGRDWRAGFIAVAALAQFLPWFLPNVASRVQFIFYMTPVTPFLVLAAVYVLRVLSRVGEGEGVRYPLGPAYVGMYVTTYVAMFVFFYPILTGWTMSYNSWHWHMWMRSWI